MALIGHKYTTALLAGTFLLLLLGSCIEDQNFDGAPANGDGNVEVKFSIQLPRASDPATRTLTAMDENEIEQIDILVFAPNGGTYVYTAQCDEITTSPGDSSQKTFTAMLREGSYDIVLLANARDALAAISLAGKTKATVMGSLDMDMPSGGWMFAPTVVTYKPIPMWGDVGNKTIDQTTSMTGTNAVKMIRMLARVDVVVDVPETNFKLSSIRVYNYDARGFVAPYTYNWDATQNVVTRASAGAARTLGPISYQNTANPVMFAIDPATNSCTSAIYLFEAENHASVSQANHVGENPLAQRVCIIVCGRYNGGPTDTFYRLDFYSGEGDRQELLDVLRNHHYIFHITGVADAGYASATEAFTYAPSNMDVGLTVWDDSNMTQFVDDGQYIFSIGEEEITFDYPQKTIYDTDNEFRIYTDFPGNVGWTIADTATGLTATWLTLSPESGKTTGGTDAKYTLNATRNITGADRSAIITFTAGRMQRTLTVTQTFPDLWGGDADILYFDAGNILRVGRYRNDNGTAGPVTPVNMALFKFGSVIGFKAPYDTSTYAWNNSHIVFNPSQFVVGIDITRYGDGSASGGDNALPSIPGFEPEDYVAAGVPSISSPDYHNGANIRIGKGDPCKLAGLNPSTLNLYPREEDKITYLNTYDSGWRLPTARENANFVGGSIAYAPWLDWRAGGSYFVYTDGPDNGTTVWNFADRDRAHAGTAADPHIVSFPVVANPYHAAYSQTLLVGAGGRDANGGGMSSFSNDAFWSSSPSAQNTGHTMLTGNVTMYPNSAHVIAAGYSIRCVRTADAPQQ